MEPRLVLIPKTMTQEEIRETVKQYPKGSVFISEFPDPNDWNATNPTAKA